MSKFKIAVTQIITCISSDSNIYCRCVSSMVDVIGQTLVMLKSTQSERLIRLENRGLDIFVSIWACHNEIIPSIPEHIGLHALSRLNHIKLEMA